MLATRGTLRLFFSTAVIGLAAATTALAQTDEAENRAIDALASGAPTADEEEVDPLVARIEQRLAELLEQRDLILALDSDAKKAAGSDQAALENAAMEARLAFLENIRQTTTAVRELEERGDDSTDYRARIVEFLPQVSQGIQNTYTRVSESNAGLKAQQAKASADAGPGLEMSIRRQGGVLLELLAGGVDQVERLEMLGLDSSKDRTWLAEQLATRARLISGRIRLAAIQLADAESRAASLPDDAALTAEAAGYTATIQSNTEALAKVVPMMESLEMESARYKQILIESTGAITTDVFDQGVAARLIRRWLSGVSESIAENGPRVAFQIVLFLLVLGIFWGLSRFVRRVTEHAVAAPHLKFSELLKRMIVSVASGMVMLVGFLVALSQLGFEVGPMVAGLGIAGFIVGFALQETLGNFAAGIMILTYRPYDVEDLIECAGGAVFGKVSHMNLVSTTILTVDNKTRVVPNGKIWGDVITNVTAQNVRRVDLVFGISYTDDIPKAEEILMSIVKEHPMVVSDPEPVVKLHELADSSVNFIVRPWAARDDYWDVHWDITREVKMRFDREDVSIPFPQQDVHFHPAAANGSGEVHLDSPPVHEKTDIRAQDKPDADGNDHDEGDAP